MRSIDEFLTQLREKEVFIGVKEGQLEVRARKQEALTPDVIAELKNRKGEILNLLESATNLGQGPEKIPPVEQKAYYELSYAQQRLFFINQLLPESIVYNMPQAICLKGILSHSHIEYVFKRLVARHEVFRTCFGIEEGRPVQFILDNDDFRLTYMKPEEQVIEKTIAAFIQPFDLQKGPLFKAALVKLSEDEHLLLIDMHHIVFDGVSQGIFTQEFVDLYHGKELEDLSLQYKDYAAWQHTSFYEELNNSTRRFWIDKLKGFSVLDLPYDFERPSKNTFEGASVGFILDHTTTSELRNVGEKVGATMFMVMLSIFNVLLSKLSNQEDVLLGTPVAGRDHGDVKSMIGMFVNTLVLRNHVKGSLGFLDFLKEVRNETIACFEHQQYPYEELVKDLNVSREANRNPLFDVLYSFKNFNDGEGLKLSGLEVSDFDHGKEISKFDLTFNVVEFEDGLSIKIAYATDIYGVETIHRYVQYLKQLVQSIISNPGQKLCEHGLLSKDERQQLLHEFNDNLISYPDLTLIDYFEQQVALNPNAGALEFKDELISYQELNETSNQISHYLKDKEIGKGDFVAIEMERSAEVVKVIYGILKSGAAYVPLDKKQPRLRKSYVLEQTAAKCLIADEHIDDYKITGCQLLIYDHLQSELSDYEETTSAAALTSDQFAYVIYTSGSTGKPKGVQITHRSLNSLIQGLEVSYPSSRKDVMLFKTNYVFDVSCHELFSWFMKGGKLSILPPGLEADPQALINEIDRHQVTRINFVPSFLGLFLEYAAKDHKKWRSLNYIFSAGEALPPDLVYSFRELKAAARLENLYGPTEATVYATYFSTSDYQGAQRMPIGKPLPHVSICVIDESLHLVPAGIRGELCLGGEALSIGYFNNPERTNQSFFLDSEGHRWYRTGDLVRLIHDGNIEYIGRIDDQVKLRGFRIELDEIDTTLRMVDGIGMAVSLVEGEKDNPRLISFYDGIEVGNETIREHLNAHLPSYMIPNQFVFMSELPLLPSGKTDKNQLIAPQFEDPSMAIEVPTNPVSLQVRDIWAELLGIEVASIGNGSDFFALGGHSLLIIRLISKVKSTWQVDLEVRDVFQHPTLGELANHLLASQSIEGLSIVAQTRPERIPLSFAQERIWFIDQLEGSQQYHIPVTIPLGNELKPVGITYALSKLRNRHEVLRTVYHFEEETIHQHILKEQEWELDIEETNNDQLQSRINEITRKPFDLKKDSPLRAKLLQIDKNGYVLVLVIHHIAFDGWSHPILSQELKIFYTQWESDSKAGLKPLPMQYADYSIWQRQLISGKRLEQGLLFWEKSLKGAEVLRLPTDFERPKVQSGKGGFVSIQISPATTEALGILSGKHQATRYMTLMAAYHVFLYLYTRQENLCVGTPMANRSNEEIEGLIGLFVNTLVIRSRLSSNMSFEEVLQQIKAFVLDAHQYQEVPFEKVVERVENNRDQSRHPLIQTMFNLHQEIKGSNVSSGKQASFESNARRENSLFDLSLIAIDQGDQLSLSLEYAADLFEKSTIELMLEQFRELLLAITTSPKQEIGALPILPATERAKLLGRKIDRSNIKKYDQFLQVYHSHVNAQPQATACVGTGEQLSYAELDQQANALANQLEQRGVSKGDRVVVLMDRTLNLVRSILAIMKLGAVYVPVDQDDTLERQRYIIEDTKAVLIITDQNQPGLESKILVLSDIWEQQSLEAQFEGGTPGDLAYLIYTSGTAGPPKGVMITHESLATRLTEERDLLGLTQVDRTITFSSHVYDVSILEIFLPLFAGASICILDRAGWQDLRIIANEISLQAVTLLQCTPGMLDALLDVKSSKQNWDHVRLICLSGKSFNQKLVNKITSKVPVAQINNHYRPTETMVDALVLTDLTDLTNFNKNLIGKPIPSINTYVLNEALDLNPVGVPGELCLSDGGVAAGYWNKPEITDKHFMADPFFPDNILYRTGDLVRQLNDGNIEFLGRIDHQLEIRGFRVELEEIEKALIRLSNVEQCIVDVVNGQSGAKEIVTWIKSQGFDENDLRDQLAHILPADMVPDHFLQVGEIPLTTNGGIDRKALPQPIQRRASFHETPSTGLESQLVSIWADLLQVTADKISVTSNFFELGGHSLLAVRMMSRIAQMLHIELPISSLFEYSTVRSLASRIEDKLVTDENGEKDRLTIVHAGEGNSELFLVHGAGGSTMVFYPLGSKCDQSSIYAFEAQGLDGEEKPLASVNELADQYVEALLKKNRNGPTNLGGYSFGGKVAYEMALKLQDMGHEVKRLVLFDALIPDHQQELIVSDALLCQIAEFFAKMNGMIVPIDETLLRGLGEAEKYEVIHRELVKNGVEISNAQSTGFINVYKANLECSYKPEIVAKPTFDILHFIATNADDSLNDPAHFDWSTYTMGNVVNRRLDADHFSILNEPHATKIALELDQFLNSVSQQYRQ